LKIFKTLISKFDLNDIFVLAGLGILGWGVWWVYPPAAVILLGAGLVWWGFRGHLYRQRNK
jgi:hypothetical protein